MRCRNCGTEINRDTIVCPGCGARIKSTEEDYESIQEAIGNKVDQFLGDGGENIDHTDDGISMRNGQMDVRHGDGDTDDLAKTINMRIPQDLDTVFPDRDRLNEKAVLPVEDEYFEDSVYQDHFSEGTYKGSNNDVYDLDPDDLEPEEEDEEDEEPGLGRYGRVILVLIVIILVLAAIAAGIFLIRRPAGNRDLTTATSETTTAVTDVISATVQNGRTYTAPLELELLSEQGLRLYYTLDGSMPSTTSMLYSGPIEITETSMTQESEHIILRVASFAVNGDKAGEMEWSFNVKMPQLAAPLISPDSGQYSYDQEIILTAEDGATIYYTYDGTTPTTDSYVYEGDVWMKRGNNVFSAIAVKGTRVSEVASAVFDLEIEPAFSFEEALEYINTYFMDNEVIIDPDGTAADGTYYQFASGGNVTFSYSGYYVIIVSHFDLNDMLLGETYYGVNDQTGEIAPMAHDGYNYYLL